MKTKQTTITLSVTTWVVLIILHIISVGTSISPQEFIWQEPQKYYSILLIDAYFILAYYVNFFFIAPRLIKKRQFFHYAYTAIILGLIPTAIPVICNWIWKWTLPGLASNVWPWYFAAFPITIALLAVGLSYRAINEWGKLSARLIQKEAEIKKLNEEKQQLEVKLTNTTEDNSTPIQTQPSTEIESEEEKEEDQKKIIEKLH